MAWSKAKRSLNDVRAAAEGLCESGPKLQDVFFDELTITHTQHPIVQETHYYPYGLAMRGIGKHGNNPWKYNGKEEQDELSLGLYDYGARFYDPALGRWNHIDPLAEVLYEWSPYSSALNNPILFVDPDGELPWPVHVRSFISTSTTGGGFFRGDSRGPSTDVTRNTSSRVRSTFTVDPSERTVSNPVTVSDPTVFFGAVTPFGTISPAVKTGDPVGSITDISSEGNALSFDFVHSGKDPITPGVVTPALDVQSSFSITEDLEKGILSISGSFTGDKFPSTEAFITDQSGKTKVFLGAQKEQGGLHNLIGENSNDLFNVNLQIQFDSNGNFTGVRQGDQTFGVEEWNNKVRDEF